MFSVFFNGREKMSRTCPYLLVGLFLIVATCGCSHLQKNDDVFFQTSTINALLEGVYDGEITFDDKHMLHGNFDYYGRGNTAFFWGISKYR